MPTARGRRRARAGAARPVTLNSAADGSYASGPLPLGNYRVRFFGIHTGSQWWQYVPTVDLATPVSLTYDGQALTGIEGWYGKP